MGSFPEKYDDPLEWASDPSIREMFSPYTLGLNVTTSSPMVSC